MRKYLKESSSEFNNVTIEMIEKLYDEGLGDYVHIKDIGPFGDGIATLEEIAGDDYGDSGYAHGYEGYEEEGFDSEDDALEDFLQNNKIYVFSKDIGQSGCNWVAENQLSNYLDDVYIDLDDVRSANSDARKVFKGLGIGLSKKESKTLTYTVKIKIDTYEDWEDDYNSFDEYVDDIVSDTETIFDDLRDLGEGVSVDIEQQ